MSQVEEGKSLQLSPPACLPPSTQPGEKYRMSTAISHISSGRRLLWRLHLCSKHLKRFPWLPSLLSSPAIYLFILSFSNSARLIFLNCLTPKIQISQLGPMSFWKMSILLPTSPFPYLFIFLSQIFPFICKLLSTDQEWIKTRLVFIVVRRACECEGGKCRGAGRAAPHLKSK